MRHILIVGMVWALIGCHTESNYSESANEYSSEKSTEYIEEDLVVMENTVQGNKQSAPLEKQNNLFHTLKLIKNGTVSFRSDELEATAGIIQKAIQAHGGYASDENETKYDGQITRRVTIRVPSNKFDALLADISTGVKQFDERSISVNDVTEEFYDLSARLKTKKEIESRYIKILSRAGKITEVLEVEKQIGEIREEIERVEGRLKFLENQVSMSTLRITYYKTLAAKSQNNDGFGHKIAQSFVHGWDMLLSILLVFVGVWPLLLLGVGVFFAIRVWRNRRI